MEQTPLFPDSSPQGENNHELLGKEGRLYNALLPFKATKTITEKEIASLYGSLNKGEKDKQDHITPKELRAYIENNGITIVREAPAIIRHGWSTSRIIRPTDTPTHSPAVPKRPPTISGKDRAAGERDED